MKVIMPEKKVFTLLYDLSEGDEFIYFGEVYIKHTENGHNGQYKCYNLSNKKWSSIGRNCAVTRCNLELRVMV
jgi:hypothetical protein